MKRIKKESLGSDATQGQRFGEQYSKTKDKKVKLIPISIRLEEDVIAFFKAEAGHFKYQQLIKNVLRCHVSNKRRVQKWQ